jgi:signal transduction histidine kinase
LPRAGRDDGERSERRMPPGVSSEIARAWPWPQGVGLVFVLGLLFVGVAAGAYPVVRRLTRRLEALQRGVEGFGSGDLTRRVDDTGKDEVASVARAFNDAAQRVETLLRSNQSLLANASHELRSPLARLKMAVSMLEPDLPAARRQQLEREIHTNIGELDALVDEVLLASRLDAQHKLDKHERVDLRAIVVEEAARTGVSVVPEAVAAFVPGDERLLRRAVRNLLENARRYGGGSVEAGMADVNAGGARVVEVRIADRGPGVPADMRERIFEPFFRLPGHAEREGGVGLGLSLVRQIAQRHGGSARVDARDGGGSVFVLSIPSSGGAGT